MTLFKAFVVDQADGKIAASIRQLDRAALPPGEVLLRVAYSSLNYKDGLAVTGRPGVVRKYPMIAGVDLAGVVEESKSPEFRPGDEVVVTGCGTSETMWGGYSQLASLDADFIIPLPRGITLLQSMAVGTAGFTAMQSIMELERHGLNPAGGDVVVTGAGGGVGSVAVAILAQLGYRTIASTGRVELQDYLRGLGAADVIDRAVLAAPSKRPMETERWAGAIDNVGGDTLAGLLRSMKAAASVAACGLAGGSSLATTVFPFILRGVNLLGINSVHVSNVRRREIWERISRDLPMPLLDRMATVEPLGNIVALGERILAGNVRGRTVIDVNA